MPPMLYTNCLFVFLGGKKLQKEEKEEVKAVAEFTLPYVSTCRVRSPGGEEEFACLHPFPFSSAFEPQNNTNSNERMVKSLYLNT